MQKKIHKISAQLKDLPPEQLKAFNDFNAAVFKDGALSKREKEIIAVAITHVTQCPYCIDAHTKAAKKAGATLEELAEAVFVTAAVEAGGTVTIVHMYIMQKIKKHQMYFMLVLI